MLEDIFAIEGSETITNRKPRILCLQGFQTSGKWPESVLEKTDFVFPDAPFPCNGKSEVKGIFDPPYYEWFQFTPYYEWFQFNKEFTVYENFNEFLDYIEECMIKHAPIDGFLGFSQVLMLILMAGGGGGGGRRWWG